MIDLDQLVGSAAQDLDRMVRATRYTPHQVARITRGLLPQDPGEDQRQLPIDLPHRQGVRAAVVGLRQDRGT